MVTERRAGLGMDEALGEALVEGAFLTREQVNEALRQSRANGVKLSDWLIEQKLISPETLATVLSFQLNVPVVELKQFQVQPEAISLVPESFAREHNVLPLSVEGDTLRVAMEEPQDLQTIDALAGLTRKRIRPVLPLRGGIKELIDANYKPTSRIAEELKAMAPPPPPPRVTAVRREPLLEPEVVAQAPVVRAVDMILNQAIKDRASDIHIVPSEEDLKVFYRIDGSLREAVSLPQGVHNALISRIKVMANMDIAERRRPQDGQFSANVEGREVNFRVATAETRNGEMMVLRVLDKATSLLQLSELGLLPGPLQAFNTLLQSPFGMIMVSGPTGSGKTTTLYAALNQLIGGDKNIMTIEDPIEYYLPGVNQIQVNRQADITFPVGLRAIMRLDPDIILVGEIRDSETATTAVQAALTGHLVLTSIHANDSVAALTRLIDMGIDPFLISSAVIGSVAQRLVRRVCPYCQTLATVSPAEALAYERELGENRTEFYIGRGCNFCSQTGFRGRVGVFEVLVLSSEIRGLIARRASAEQIKEQAIKEGMITLRRDGMLKAKDGITTPGEVIRNVFTIE